MQQNRKRTITNSARWRARGKHRRATLWSSLPILLGFIAGCEQDPFRNPRDTTSQPTLGSTVIEEPGETPEDTDVLNVAEVEPRTAILTFTASQAFCCSPLALVLSADLAIEDGAGLPSFEWDFGDGRTANGARVQHTFPWSGEFGVVLTATWPDGTIDSVNLTIAVGFQDDGDIVLTPAAIERVVADAGPDSQADPGEQVLLDGGESYASSGRALSFIWIQTRGPRVVLETPSEETTWFIAPLVDEFAALAFQLTVIDGTAQDSDEVGVTVGAGTGVPDENTAPTVEDATLAVMPDTTVAVLLVGEDIDGDDLTFSIVRQPIRGALGDLNNTPASTATVGYTPDPGFVGTDTFTFRATDGAASSGIGTATVTVGSAAGGPIAVSSAHLCQVDTPGTLTLLGGGDSGADLAFRVVGGPSYGTLSPIQPAGSQSAQIVYSPEAGFEGIDSFTFDVSAGAETSDAATVTITVTKAILPWLEVNLPRRDASEFHDESDGAEPGMTMLDFALAGLEHWANVTDRVILTTTPGQVAYLYPELMPRIPAGMRVYGGVKPYSLPGVSPYDPNLYDFADAEGWLELAEIAQEITSVTGTNVFLLENETALTPFHGGLEEIDLERLRTALQPLAATGIEVWWNVPRLQPDSEAFPDRHARTVDLVTAIAEAVPNSVFLTSYTAWNGWQNNAEKVALRLEMIDLVGIERIQERLLVTPDGYWYWPSGEVKRCFTAAEAVDEMRGLPLGPINIYSGGSGWIRTGEVFAATLPPLAPDG